MAQEEHKRKKLLVKKTESKRPVIVSKDTFDATLSKLLHASPTPRKAIGMGRKQKPAKIIAPREPTA